MANETEQGNIIMPTDVTSDGISANLIEDVVVLPLIYSEDIAFGVSNVKKFRKKGLLVGEGLAESTGYSYGANSEYVESSVTSTATMFVCVSKVTNHAIKFTRITNAEIQMEQAAGIRRDLEDEILALFSSLSNQVTATSTLTTDDLIDAQYNVRSGTAGKSKGMLAGVFDFKGLSEVQKQLSKDGATAISNPRLAGLLNGVSMENGFRGEYSGIALYETQGLPTSGGDDVAAVFDPALCFAQQITSAIDTSQEWDGENFHWVVSSNTFHDVVEWNDAAGCGVLSDT